MSDDVIKKIVSSTVKDDYVGFSEFTGNVIEDKMREKISEKVSEIQTGLFERGEYNTGGKKFSQDSERDQFNDKPGGDERKSDKGGKKVKNKMKTEQEEEDDKEMNAKGKKPNPFAKKDNNDKGKKPNPFAKKDDSDDEEDNDDEEDSEDKIKNKDDDE